MRYLLALAILLFCPFSGQAQWQTVATNGQSVKVPIGMVLRYGSPVDNMWSTPKLYTQNSSFSIGSGQFPVNPDPNAKVSTLVIQAYQLPIPQTITVAGNAVTVTTPVPTPAVAGTAAYCPTGKAKTANINITVTPETGLIAAGSQMTCQ
jgi:hypothetical protein